MLGDTPPKTKTKTRIDPYGTGVEGSVPSSRTLCVVAVEPAPCFWDPDLAAHTLSPGLVPVVLVFTFPQP